jgi:hypothetical protein
MIVLSTETNIISQTSSITARMTWDESGAGLLLDFLSVVALFGALRKTKHSADSNPSLFVYSLFILTSCHLDSRQSLLIVGSGTARRRIWHSAGG